MIKTDVFVKIGYTKSDILDAICNRLPVEKCEISELKILKSSLDINKEEKSVSYRLSVGISLSAEREAGLLKMRKKVAPVQSYDFVIPAVRLNSRPVVVGAGPCGLFAALLLAQAGAAPIILERGLSVGERRKKVDAFRALGVLDPECNVQFGEGGAGTYSDGKLKVGSMDKYKMKVLSEFCLAGADADVLHSMTAHLGTDKLSDIVKNIREKIISLGGEFIFSAKLVDICLKDGAIYSVKYEKGGELIDLFAENLILAIGHSAKDTFERLLSHKVGMVAKGFGMGVRIEHPREYINEMVYGKSYDSRLESASYHLVTHLPSGRSVYSFCMCPGGTVVPAASEKCGIVTNGMSEYARMADNSNAAFLVSLTPEDYPSDSPLSGMELQRRIEALAYSLGGKDYSAPIIRMEDFLKDEKPLSPSAVLPSYPVGTRVTKIDSCLPNCVTDSLRAAILDFEAWSPGFYMPDAILTAPETRSTSPVRILRSESYEAIGISGLYPAGEGAGYSGGIVSSATDGLRCAEAMLEKYKI